MGSNPIPSAKMQNKSLVLMFVVSVFILGGLLYIYNPSPEEYGKIEADKPEQVLPEPVFCTQDAILCSDGSYVGRSGPNCEFECPEPATTTPAAI
ncbi:MAG TPA: hypothetical protein VJB58_00585 [Candidatus Paceibacterota bacterium]